MYKWGVQTDVGGGGGGGAITEKSHYFQLIFMNLYETYMLPSKITDRQDLGKVFRAKTVSGLKDAGLKLYNIKISVV